MLMLLISDESSEMPKITSFLGFQSGKSNVYDDQEESSQLNLSFWKLHTIIPTNKHMGYVMKPYLVGLQEGAWLTASWILGIMEFNDTVTEGVNSCKSWLISIWSLYPSHNGYKSEYELNNLSICSTLVSGGGFHNVTSGPNPIRASTIAKASLTISTVTFIRSNIAGTKGSTFTMPPNGVKA